MKPTVGRLGGGLGGGYVPHAYGTCSFKAKQYIHDRKDELADLQHNGIGKRPTSIRAMREKFLHD